MTELVLFGIGSPIVVEYEETCRRLGVAIVAGVRNRPGATDFHGRVVDADAVSPSLLTVPCLCPLFAPSNRHVAHDEAVARGFRTAAALIDPTAIVASSAAFGVGSFVNAGCIVGARTRVAEHVVINRGASVGHHVDLAEFASLGPGVVIAGNVIVETGAMIGACAVILPSVRIGAHAVVGAGSVVVNDVPPHVKVLGNPARGRSARGGRPTAE